MAIASVSPHSCSNPATLIDQHLNSHTWMFQSYLYLCSSASFCDALIGASFCASFCTQGEDKKMKYFTVKYTVCIKMYPIKIITRYIHPDTMHTLTSTLNCLILWMKMMKMMMRRRRRMYQTFHWMNLNYWKNCCSVFA